MKRTFLHPLRGPGGKMALDRSTLAEFFREGVTRAQQRQNLPLKEVTQFYLVNLLAEFHAAEKLFGAPESEKGDQPLALLFAQAAGASNEQQRFAILKEIGDKSLYVSGFFADSFRRKIIDIDYYIAMGETAYSHVSSLARDRRVVLSEVFEELADKFVRLVDIFSEISEMSGLTSDQDLLRIYERWLLTRSARLSEKLREKGILPLADATRNNLQ